MKKGLLTILSMAFISSMVFAAEKSIVMTGSTTVLPLAQATAEIFMDQNEDIDISVQGGGSGVGVAAVIDNTCDIANSSRPMKDKEKDNAKENGVNAVEHIVAMDGIAIAIHPSNPIEALTKAQVKDIYTGKVSNWKEVGGKDQKIVAISRDSASGTYEAFHVLALNKDKFRADAIRQTSNNSVAQVVGNTPGGIGYIGLGYITPKVKVVTVEGVVPSNETVNSKEYAYSRPLYMYTNGEPTGIVKEYLDFVKSKEGQKVVAEQGFVPIA